jgi:clan AA aspartic protease (TIGR02281 family)
MTTHRSQSSFCRWRAWVIRTGPQAAGSGGYERRQLGGKTAGSGSIAAARDPKRTREAPMTVALRVLGLAFAVVAAAVSAHGEIYRWTDARGQIHFTERIDQVPRDQREAARAGAASSSAARVHTYTGSTAEAPTPPAARDRGSREIEIPFQRIGSLMRVDAMVNDVVSIPFLVDTGASGVSIPTSYATKLGVRIRPDTPHVQVTTANGVVARPLISLRSVEIEGARIENLTATIDPGLEFGLLGGSFFNNYVYRVDAARSVMTLTPNEEIRGGMAEAQWRERFHTWTDPLRRLEAYLRDHPYIEAHERAALTVRQQQLQAGLDDLERRADELGVPQIWREGGAK